MGSKGSANSAYSRLVVAFWMRIELWVLARACRGRLTARPAAAVRAEVRRHRQRSERQWARLGGMDRLGGDRADTPRQHDVNSRHGEGELPSRQGREAGDETQDDEVGGAVPAADAEEQEGEVVREPGSITPGSGT